MLVPGLYCIMHRRGLWTEVINHLQRAAYISIFEGLWCGDPGSMMSYAGQLNPRSQLEHQQRGKSGWPLISLIDLSAILFL